MNIFRKIFDCLTLVFFLTVDFTVCQYLWHLNLEKKIDYYQLLGQIKKARRIFSKPEMFLFALDVAYQFALLLLWLFCSFFFRLIYFLWVQLWPPFISGAKAIFSSKFNWIFFLFQIAELWAFKDIVFSWSSKIGIEEVCRSIFWHLFNAVRLFKNQESVLFLFLWCKRNSFLIVQKAFVSMALPFRCYCCCEKKLIVQGKFFSCVSFFVSIWTFRKTKETG